MLMIVCTLSRGVGAGEEGAGEEGAGRSREESEEGTGAKRGFSL